MRSRVLGYCTVAEVCDDSHETLWIALQKDHVLSNEDIP
jgi:hypothetical protein